MRNWLIYTFITLKTTSALAQNIIPSLVAPLPYVVNESSGLALTPSSGAHVWTHNDSGGLPEIYRIDTNGIWLQTIFLKNTTAVDFEDITKDAEGNLFIGDIGDNEIARQNYFINKIPAVDLAIGDSIVPKQISFIYPNQQSYDCEAFFHCEQSLFLFTKTHVQGEYTKLFSLPDSCGTYTATLIDSFYFSSPITAADINQNGTMVLLLSYGKIYFLSSFNPPNFFSGNNLAFNIPLSQTEGIAFINDAEAFITDEKFMGAGGNLYYFEITPLIAANDQKEPENESVIIYPNPSDGIINFESRVAVYSIDIMDRQGKLVYHQSDENWPSCMSEKKIKYPAELSKGIYFLRAITDSGKGITKKIFLR